MPLVYQSPTSGPTEAHVVTGSQEERLEAKIAEIQDEIKAENELSRNARSRKEREVIDRHVLRLCRQRDGLRDQLRTLRLTQPLLAPGQDAKEEIRKAWNLKALKRATKILWEYGTDESRRLSVRVDSEADHQTLSPGYRTLDDSLEFELFAWLKGEA